MAYTAARLLSYAFSGPRETRWRAPKVATINGARALNVGAKLGTIEPGKSADCFIIQGNPLDDVRNTRSVQTVIMARRVSNSAALLDSISGTMGSGAPSEDVNKTDVRQ